MWDDWIMLAWIAQGRADWVLQFHTNYGITPFFLVDFPWIALGFDAATTIRIAKICYVFGVIANAILILLVSEKVSHGNRLFAMMAGILAVTFPAISGEGFHLSMLKYYFFIPLFFAGNVFFMQVARADWKDRRLAIRLTALAALFASFSLNSLLALFYALVPAVIYASWTKKPQCARNLVTHIRSFVVRHLDFLALPLVFWILKSTLMPRTGIYARYNALRFDWSGIAEGYGRLIPDILQTTVFGPFSIQFVPLAAAVVFVIFMVVGSQRFLTFTGARAANHRQLLVLLGLGFVVLIGAAFPYYLVGRRGFQAFGFMSRDNVLFPLAVSWITAALFCLVLQPSAGSAAAGTQRIPFVRRAALGMFAALVFAQCISNWRNHIDWQAHYVYYRSALAKIANDETVRNASVIQVMDRLPGDRSLQGWKYPTSIWTEMVSAPFQKTTRLVLPMPPENGRYYVRDELERRVRETEVDFMLQDIDLNGPQAKLTIEPAGEMRSPVRLALAYWKARFFAPSELPKLLDSVTRIEIQSMSR